MNLHQHGLNRSIILHLREAMDMRVDLVFDGYEYPSEKPFITVEQMPSNIESNVKQREAFEVIYRFQIGLHDVNSVQLSINQEKLRDIFNFDKFTFYNTLKDSSTPAGSFLCELTSVVPMPSDEISNKSEYHRVYFDVEIKSTKRRR